MSEKVLKIRLRHPLHNTALELELPAATTFREIQNLLIKNGFLEKRTPDYAFILNRRICALNKSLASYISPDAPESVEIQVNGLLTIMS